jgi:uncharacterized protein YbcV (DUF1398 family)
MTSIIEKLQAAQKFAMANRPKIGGFPFLAECLRQAGVRKNTWSLPGCQSVYLMENGSIVQQGTPLLSGSAEIPAFDEAGLIAAIRRDQAGEGTFPEFLMSAWKAGVVQYVVDFEARTVAYYGIRDESYVEEYPAVEVSMPN